MRRGSSPFSRSDLAAGRSGRVVHPLEFHCRDHVGIRAVAVLLHGRGIEIVEAGRQDDGADLDLLRSLSVVVVDALLGTDLGADHAAAGLEVDAVLADRCAAHWAPPVGTASVMAALGPSLSLAVIE